MRTACKRAPTPDRPPQACAPPAARARTCSPPVLEPHPCVVVADEKGFNVITLTDCTATTSADGQRGATEGTYGMFSQPMTAAEFAMLIE